MTLLLRTLAAFPTGRTTGQIMALLDTEFDAARRAEVRGELEKLQKDGVVRQGADGRWRLSSAQSRPTAKTGEARVSEADPIHGAELPAVVATFRSAPAAVQEDAELGLGQDALPNPKALLSYYLSALQSDPRGALTQAPDRHGQVYQLVCGTGRLAPKDGEISIIQIALGDLPDPFREALSRRASNERSLAVGWPISVGQRSGAPCVRPVGLLAAQWDMTDRDLIIRIAVDDVMINPDWAQAYARASAWTVEALNSYFAGGDGDGRPAADFLAKLGNAASASVIGSLTGQGFATRVDVAQSGIIDAVGLFLPTADTFSAGVVRDIGAMLNWSEDQIASTALAPLLGMEPRQAPSETAVVINTGPLNLEQIEAVRMSMNAPLTVVTGPPGTGKSQAIVAMAASALADGQSVIVASKNHQALDAVQERLGGLAKDTAFLVRTLNPSESIDVGMKRVLGEICATDGATSWDALEDLGHELSALSRSRLDAMDRLRKRQELQVALADDLERLAFRRERGLELPQKPPSEMARVGVWTRVLDWIFRRRLNDVSLDEPAHISSLDLAARIAKRRASLDQLAPVPDLVALTGEITHLASLVLPKVLKRRTMPDLDTRLKLRAMQQDLELDGQLDLSRDVAKAVVSSRPLWLVSVLGTPKRVPLYDGLFDLAIFDEASQCDIASALPVLARARRVVIVGDDKQLSFIPKVSAAADRNLMDAAELPRRGRGRYAQGLRSLFDFAASVPQAQRVTLCEQYRSAADIVSYINQDFYQGRLRVAADHAALRTPEGMKPGLAWTDVPGRRGTGNVNPAEVEAITAHLVMLLVDQSYSGSVGIISPFRDQVAALQRSLRAALPEMVREGADLRVGTVDGFQGQERDVILFSPVVCAGSGMNSVGFLQKDWRRINVAISRGRAVAHVFGDLTYARTGAVKRLQSLAARATDPQPIRSEGDFDSEWERIVDAALRRRGLTPYPQYEIAGRRLDFALFGSGGVQLDLEVDGRRWHTDTDGNRKLDDHWRDATMRGLGWKVRRFWVDELDRDLEKCIGIVEDDLA